MWNTFVQLFGVPCIEWLLQSFGKRQAPSLPLQTPS